MEGIALFLNRLTLSGLSLIADSLAEEVKKLANAVGE
jgi:hypothetical protein